MRHAFSSVKERKGSGSGSGEREQGFAMDEARRKESCFGVAHVAGSQLDELRDGLVLGGSEGQCSDDTSPGGSVKGVKISGKGLLNKVKQASFGGCEGCKQGLSY